MSGTTSRRQLPCREAWWEGSQEAKVGLDEQESDIRPMLQGKEAIDSDAQYSSGSSIGKSGEAREESITSYPGISVSLSLETTAYKVIMPRKRLRFTEVSRGHSSR
jgi:hypothetical protein